MVGIPDITGKDREKSRLEGTEKDKDLEPGTARLIDWEGEKVRGKEEGWGRIRQKNRPRLVRGRAVGPWGVEASVIPPVKDGG